MLGDFYSADWRLQKTGPRWWQQRCCSLQLHSHPQQEEQLFTSFLVKSGLPSIFKCLQCDRQLALQIVLVSLALITSKVKNRFIHYWPFRCLPLRISLHPLSSCYWIVVLDQILFTYHGLNIFFVTSAVNNFSSLSSAS